MAELGLKLLASSEESVGVSLTIRDRVRPCSGGMLISLLRIDAVAVLLCMLLRAVDPVGNALALSTCPLDPPATFWTLARLGPTMIGPVERKAFADLSTAGSLDVGGRSICRNLAAEAERRSRGAPRAAKYVREDDPTARSFTDLKQSPQADWGTPRARPDDRTRLCARLVSV
jgi:hypothetical protein